MLNIKDKTNLLIIFVKLVIIFLLFTNIVIFANNNIQAKDKTDKTDKNNHSVLQLNKAISVALRNNPNLAKIQARYNALSQIPDQKGSLADPMLILNAMNVPTDTFDLNQEAMTQMQIGISQVFPFPGKLALSKKASEYDAKAYGYLINEAKLQIIWHIKHTWWQIFFIDRSLDVINTNKNLFREFIEVAKKKYEVGKGLQQDVLLAQLELSKLLDKDLQLKALRRNEVIKLNILMDVSPLNNITLPAEIKEEIPIISKKEEELYKIAKSTRPILFEKKERLAAAETRLDLAEKEFFPNFKVDVIYGHRQGNNPTMMGGGKRSNLLSAKLGVSIPLYASTKQSKEVKQREQEVIENKYSIQDEHNRVYQEISIALTNYNQAKEQYLLYKSGIIPQAEQTVSSMLSGYQVNKVDFLNLIRSQITLLNYEVQYWKSFTDTKKANAKLIAAVGSGEYNEI